jgi:hypothetical protein
MDKILLPALMFCFCNKDIFPYQYQTAPALLQALSRDTALERKLWTAAYS